MPSLLEVNKELKRHYNTLNNKKEDFIIGDRVQVICAACDFNFFYNETGIVIDYADNYYSIKVKFDEVREFDIGFDQETFYFNPTDLVNINDE